MTTAKKAGFGRANKLPPAAAPEGLDAFAGGANEHTTAAGAPAPVVVPIAEAPAAPVAPPEPAEVPDLMHPKAKPNQATSLRLNDYQMGLIREVAAILSKPHEKCSIQQAIKRNLIPALEKVREEARAPSSTSE